MLLGQIAVLSGVPDYVFGSQVSRRAPESEPILFAAQTKRSTPSAVNWRPTTDRRYHPMLPC